MHVDTSGSHSVGLQPSVLESQALPASQVRESVVLLPSALQMWISEPTHSVWPAVHMGCRQAPARHTWVPSQLLESNPVPALLQVSTARPPLQRA